MDEQGNMQIPTRSGKSYASTTSTHDEMDALIDPIADQVISDEKVKAIDELKCFVQPKLYSIAKKQCSMERIKEVARKLDLASISYRDILSLYHQTPEKERIFFLKQLKMVYQMTHFKPEYQFREDIFPFLEELKNLAGRPERDHLVKSGREGIIISDILGYIQRNASPSSLKSTDVILGRHHKIKQHQFSPRFGLTNDKTKTNVGLQREFGF